MGEHISEMERKYNYLTLMDSKIDGKSMVAFLLVSIYEVEKLNISR